MTRTRATASQGRGPRGPLRVCAACTLLLATLSTALSAAPSPAAHAVVFMYHRVGDARYPSTNVTEADLKAELDYLQTNNFHVLGLAQIVKALSDGGTLPDRTVAITVDDAYQSFYQHAYPLLREHGWPFTIFVSTDAVDRNLPDFMSWEEMREMAAHGASFANHSATHAHLVDHLNGESDAAWSHRVERDILKAQSRLHAELGGATNEEPRLFAYPYGEYTPALAALVTRLGFVAFGQESGALGPIDDQRALPRFPIAEAFSGMKQFALKAASLPLELKAVDPWDPVVTRGQVPVLTLTLDPAAPIVRSQLACYDSDGQRISLEWLDDAHTRARVQGEPSAQRRSRYNCTAPDSTAAGRYHWYSHPWFIFH